MKKIIVLVLSVMVLLNIAGCNKNKREVTILSPMGTPILSQMYIEDKKDEYNYKIDKVEGADALSAAFISKSYDFIYAPINLGIKMYINNKNYKLLSTVVDCNYYFVYISDSELTLNDIVKKDIVIFSESSMSGILSKYILESNHYSLDELDITYVSSVADSMSSFILDNSIVALLSEPQITILESKVGSLKLFSIKDEYQRLTGYSNLPQAGVFYRSDLDKDIVNKYKEQLKDSIYNVNNNPEESSLLGAKLNENYSYDTLSSSISRSEIVYTENEDLKNKVNQFIDLINSYNPKLIGGEIDDEFFYN